jgi:hypothetical protein
MLRPITKLRFKKEPTGLRGNPGTAMLTTTGHDAWQALLDDVTGLVYLQRGEKPVFVLHASDCEWIELAGDLRIATGVIVQGVGTSPSAKGEAKK